MTSTHNIPTIEDPLADALRIVRMDGMFYCPSELTGPWGVFLPEMPDALWFHVITSGSCTLEDAEGHRYEVHEGDVVVLPNGGGHCAYDLEAAPRPAVFDLPHEYLSEQYGIMRHGGGGELTTLICGVVRFGHPAARSLRAVLPDVIHVTRPAEADWPWFPALLDLMGDETKAPKPGGEAVITRLCDILVIQSIRWWLEHETEATTGWIVALRDPAVGRAIALIHRDAARAWTVDELAAEAAMSRSGFAARFSELVGEPPMQYLTRWRMLVAEDRLLTTSDTLFEIAQSLGYNSEAAFSRAFKRVVGIPPSHVRST